MAVVFNDVYYSHQDSRKNNYALKGIYMNVPVGCIYGLLGPSGCGKTTLLKCLIGLLRPQCGKVSVFGFNPGDERSGVPGIGVGYMPQELAVQYDLTVEEILTYFGKINCMKIEKIKIEINFLVKILELKDKKQLIGNLSGGQKRRVSLAIAMIHKPRLLILDEPTVGVDPILSEVIWKLLSTLSTTQKTTIIITTHYINETKRANIVAFMRTGEILEENNPQALIIKHNSRNLDEVFLKICEQQKQQRRSFVNRSLSSSLKISEAGKNVHLQKSNVSVNKIQVWLKIMTAIIWKYLIETRRNPISVLMILFTTASIVFAIVLIVGKTPIDLPLAFVVDENSNLNNSSDHTRSSNGTFYNLVHGENETASAFYDELYLPTILKQSINHKIVNLIEYSNFTQALHDARKRIVYGVLHLKSNFSASYLQRDLILADVDDYVRNETIESGNIYLHLDCTNVLISKTIELVLLFSLQAFRRKIALHYEIDELLLSPPISLEPVNIEDKPVTSIEDVFSTATFLTPGLVAFNSFAICIGLSVVSLLTPAECNMITRNYSAGVNATHIVFGQIVARFIFMALNAILNLLAMVYILGVPCNGPILLIIPVMWTQMFLGLCAGTVMSATMTTSHGSLCAGILVLNLLFTTSGVARGIESLPYYLKWFIQYSPIYYSVRTLRSLLFYSSTPLALIGPGFFYAFIWIVVFLIAGIACYSCKK